MKKIKAVVEFELEDCCCPNDENLKQEIRDDIENAFQDYFSVKASVPSIEIS